ncbi:MAG: hypothetical protein V4568_18795 [Pseudomonadota bacterium]
MNDACEVTGYTRNQLRGMLRDLPSFVESETTPRSARAFTRTELLAICVITQMESRYGIRRAAIGTVVEQLLSTLQGPRPINPAARLNVIVESGLVTYLSENSGVTEGLLIPLGPIFERVDHYLGGHSDAGEQAELPLGPGILREKQHG